MLPAVETELRQLAWGRDEDMSVSPPNDGRSDTVLLEVTKRNWDYPKDPDIYRLSLPKAQYALLAASLLTTEKPPVPEGETHPPKLSRWLADNGTPHADDGLPAVHRRGEDYWYCNGEIHREDGPAVVIRVGDSLRYEAWFQNGQPSRENGLPHAVEHLGGRRRIEVRLGQNGEEDQVSYFNGSPTAEPVVMRGKAFTVYEVTDSDTNFDRDGVTYDLEEKERHLFVGGSLPEAVRHFCADDREAATVLAKGMEDGELFVERAPENGLNGAPSDASLAGPYRGSQSPPEPIDVEFERTTTSLLVRPYQPEEFNRRFSVEHMPMAATEADKAFALSAAAPMPLPAAPSPDLAVAQEVQIAGR